MTNRPNNSREPVLLLMDGECLLCHGLTRFMINRDAKRRFRFAALQSEAGRYVLERTGWSGRLPDSFIMVQGPPAIRSRRLRSAPAENWADCGGCCMDASPCRHRFGIGRMTLSPRGATGGSADGKPAFCLCRNWPAAGSRP